MFTAAALLYLPGAVLAHPAASGDVEAIEVAGKADDPVMRPIEGGIELTAGASESTTFMIYSITGQLVKNAKADAASSITLTLPGGCYIVRCQAWAKKIVVRS